MELYKIFMTVTWSVELRNSTRIIELYNWFMQLHSCSMELNSLVVLHNSIVPFHKDFSPSGEQLEHRKLANEL